MTMNVKVMIVINDYNDVCSVMRTTSSSKITLVNTLYNETNFASILSQLINFCPPVP